jgi:hypothetical protein
MRDTRFGTVALVAAVVLVGCATGKNKVEASSEVIYEEADAGSASAASADPFAGCQAKQDKSAIILSCGPVTGAYLEVARQLGPVAVEQDLSRYEASFPPQSTRERFTQRFGDVEAMGSRVYEDSPVQPFRSELVYVPSGNGTRVLQCIVRGSVDWTRCGKIVEQMAASGVPPRVPGAPQPSAAPGDGGTVSGDAPPSSGGVSPPAASGSTTDSTGTAGGTTPKRPR